jgi:hypothetical protein
VANRLHLYGHAMAGQGDIIAEILNHSRALFQAASAVYLIDHASLLGNYDLLLSSSGFLLSITVKNGDLDVYLDIKDPPNGIPTPENQG